MTAEARVDGEQEAGVDVGAMLLLRCELVVGRLRDALIEIPNS